MNRLPIVLVLLFIVAVIFMFFGIFDQNKEEDFWNWFTKNEEALFAVSSGKEPVAEKLTREMRSIDKNLVWAIGGSPKDSVRDLVISADGIKSSFPNVVSLYNSAPKNLSRWRFVAFRPKTNMDSVQFNGKTRKVDEFYFKSSKNGDKFDVDIYVKNFEKEVDDNITYIFLDSLLGEYVVETRLGIIDTHSLEENNIIGILPLKQIENSII